MLLLTGVRLPPTSRTTLWESPVTRPPARHATGSTQLASPTSTLFGRLERPFVHRTNQLRILPLDVLEIHAADTAPPQAYDCPGLLNPRAMAFRG